MKTINLFEYQNREDINNDIAKGLEEFLDEIWAKRDKNTYYINEEIEDSDNQQFIQFLRKTNQIKSNNYVGIIHYENYRVNLLPKIFFKPTKNYQENDIQKIQYHILWWLSYCRKIKFPNYQASFGSIKSDFFEVLIYLFSKYTNTLLQSFIYQAYEDIERELPYVKGRLNFPVYINENLSRGIWHKFNCSFDMSVMDNKFNRIIKYVANMLLAVTQEQDNKKNLREILFVLDEVADEPATSDQCKNLKFNPLFSEFEIVRDYCYLFLANSIQFTFKNDLRLFAFLLPMEYVFEDFVFGFIDKELPQISVQSQKSDTYLDENKNFRLKPDFYIKTEHENIIADAKYKILDQLQRNNKKISQNDLYQMVAYAIRFESEKVFLYYPNIIEESLWELQPILIKDKLSNNREITIYPTKLSIINEELFSMDTPPNRGLEATFKSTTKNLKSEILQSIAKVK